MKAGKYLRGAAWLMAFSTLILINIVWFRFEGSKGTAPVMLVMLLFCVSLFFRKIEKAVFLLFYIEYAYPFLINPLQDQIIRMADLFLTYTICGVFIIFVTQVLLRSYALEKAKAEQVDKLKSSFLANISHEIRTPLNAILGFATLIAEDDTSLNDRKLYARFMLDASKSLTNLIEEIIDIARIESDQVNIQKERCNIRDILELVYAHFDNATERQIKSSVSFNTVPASFENDVFIETDALILKQVLIEHLLN